MTNILTAAEAANAVRTDVTDQAMLDLLPGVDAYIKRATGHNFAADTTIAPEAKNAARMLLVMWYDNPAQLASGIGSLPQGLTATLLQLETLAQTLTFAGCNGSGYCSLPGAEVGDLVAGLVCIYPTPADATTLFESIITYCGYIKQVSGSNLALNSYRVRLTSPELP